MIKTFNEYLINESIETELFNPFMRAMFSKIDYKNITHEQASTAMSILGGDRFDRLLPSENENISFDEASQIREKIFNNISSNSFSIRSNFSLFIVLTYLEQIIK